MPAIAGVDDALDLRVVHLQDVRPDREQIHRLVHLQPGHDGHRRWVEIVDQMLADTAKLLRPRGIYRIDPVISLTRHRVTLKSGVAFHGSVGTFLAHSHLVATFVVTIGSALERLSRRWLKAGKPLHGLIADAIASEAAEATAAGLQDEIRTWARARGLDITPRYSPGYCGLSVQQQIPLFASLPASRINVRLTPSCLMLPLKSVSGLIGLGPADQVSPGGYPCETCDHPECSQRRAPCRRSLDAGQT
jgi:hypothetical protein